MKETIVYGKTVALALKRGAEELGVDESKAEYEVLEEPKKGFFGVGASDAKLRVYYQPSPGYEILFFQHYRCLLLRYTTRPTMMIISGANTVMKMVRFFAVSWSSVSGSSSNVL